MEIGLGTEEISFKRVEVLQAVEFRTLFVSYQLIRFIILPRIKIHLNVHQLAYHTSTKHAATVEWEERTILTNPDDPYYEALCPPAVVRER